MQEFGYERLRPSFELAERYLSPILMPAESLERIRRLSQAWPVYAAEFFGFECRLGPDIHATDCALNLTRDGARMLAGRHSQSAPAELKGEAWNRIAGFYQEWGDTRSPAYADAHCTWLEFDSSSEETPAPNLLFGYWPDVTDAKRPTEWLINLIIPRLLGRPLSKALEENLQRCFDARPPGTGDFQIGVMLSRDIQAVRVCVFDLNCEQVPSYLETIGWRGPLKTVLEYIEAFEPSADFIGLHLDVGEVVYPHIGVEPNFASGRWARQPHREPRWAGQFDTVERFGLLAPQKKEALLNWVGHQQIAAGGSKIVLLRGLSHIKVVIKPNADAIAKAYFGIAHSQLGADQ